jgi:hypothetical protein
VNKKKWRKWCKFVSPFLSNNTFGLPVLTKDTKCSKQVFYVWLVDLQPICVNKGQETWVSPNKDIRIYLLDTMHRRTKYSFDTCITWNNVNGVCLFHLSYLITLMAYLCTQRIPNVHVEYFMIESSIYLLFVLISAWKRDSLLMMIFVNVWLTWRIFELNSRFVTWITRNDIIGVNLFHLCYLSNTCPTSAHNGHQMFKSSILCLNGRSTAYLCEIGAGNVTPSK